MKRDILVTFISQAFSLLAGFLLMTLLASSYGEYGVGFFSIVRRVPSAYVPIVLMGSSIAISRELLKARQESLTRYVSLVLSGLIMMVFNLAVSLLVIILLKETILEIIAGKASFVAIESHTTVLIFFLWLCSEVLFTFGYAFFRGRLSFLSAACFQILWSIIPMLLLYYGRTWPISRYVLILSLVYVCVSLCVAIYILVEVLRFRQLSLISLWQEGKYILSFGIPRLPLFFIFSWIVNGGIFLLAWVGEKGDSGRYSLSFSLLRYISMSVSSVGVVLLPRMRASDQESNKHKIRALTTFILDTLTLALLVVLPMFPWFMVHYLHIDSSYAGSVGLKILLLLGVPGIVAYELLRNVLDAISVRPYNTLHSVLSLACGGTCFAAFYWLADVSAADAVYIATGVLFLVLGFFSIWRSNKLLEINLSRELAFPLVQVLVAGCLWALGLNHVLILVLLLVIFILGLVYLDRPWVRAVLSR